MCNASGTTVQVILAVYMPYYDSGNKHQTEEYLLTIDALQSCIDKYATLAPLKILGDFNVQLPRADKLSDRWFCKKGFNRHGSIAYDFISANDLLVADFMYPQPEMSPHSHTLFCVKRNVYTWIDHVLSSDYDSSNIYNCQIIPLEEGNVSDHLPVQVSFYVPVSNDPGRCTLKHKSNHHSTPNWSNVISNNRYKVTLNDKLQEINLLTVPGESSKEDAQRIINDYVNRINDTLHAATQEAGCVNKGSFKPKPYWCPELTKLRDRKRFWWKLWVANGRPREGAVFDCYKGIKKLFRKICRNNIANLSQLQCRKLNSMYHSRNICGFWNSIRKFRGKKNANSTLSSQGFADYFNGIMNDKGYLSTQQQNIDDFVKDCFDKNQNYKEEKIISVADVSKLLRALKMNSAPGQDGITGEHLVYGESDTLCRHLASLYSAVLSWNIVPDGFRVGTIIPVLKKPTLNPNDAGNYRPITLSSVYSKLLENIIIPDDNASETQFGFRSKRGTAFGCRLLNDIVHYQNSKGSPVYVCSLDAEKCFDRIWHSGLLQTVGCFTIITLAFTLSLVLHNGKCSTVGLYS